MMYSAKPRARYLWIVAATVFLLTACGGGGNDGPTTPGTQGVGGGGVKGPLANAVVTAYAFSSSAAGFKGAVIDTGTTGADAKITGLNLTLPLAPPYILEFTSNSGTIDITTGVAPVITIMRTVLTQALLDTGEDIYATPLTTMATDLAVANADSNIAPFTGDNNGTTTAAEFVAALPVAASQVSSTLGFGIDSSIDIFDTPPLVDDTTDTIAEQTAVAAYRAAIEAVTAVVYEMNQQASGTTPDAVLAELTSDLAADGVINGVTESGPSTILTTTVLDVLSQDPATLGIPNSDDGTGNPILVADVEQVLIDETATTGTTTSTTQLDPTTGSIDTVIALAETNSDIDGDGVMNANDAFPNDATETADTDGDGVGDNADAFPNDATETADTDGDGVGDNADAFPNNASETVDTDGDGVGDNADAFPNDATETADTDGDGVGDNADAFPNDATETVDTDGDGVGDNADAFPNDATETLDTDGDGVGNNSDNCPTVANASQTDTDGDGIGDACETGPALDAAGVWDATVTVTNLSPFVTNGCMENDPVSTVSRMYLTMTQTGTSLVAKTVWGDNLSGSINAAGAFTLNGVTTRTDAFTGDVDTDTISISGTLSSATVWNGMATITSAFTPSGGSLENQCTETASLASAFVYKHTGSEDYSGIYGFEVDLDVGGSSGRTTVVLELETAASNLSMYTPIKAIADVFDSYDPVTGFFSMVEVSIDNRFDGTSQVWTDNFTGIFVRAPGDSSGPQVSFAVDSYDESFSGPNGTGTRTSIEYQEIEAYGKRVSTQGITRSRYYRPSGGGGDRNDVRMGLAYPPLKGNKSNQYLEVLDSDGSTRLCTRSFDQGYRLFQYLPVVDMSTEQFQSQTYSSLICNTFSTGIRVLDGMDYTVRIRDMGADATLDGGDDTTLFSQSVIAVLHPSVFTEKPSANDFALNGAVAPTTMKRGDRDGAINLFGYFNVNQAMDFSWTGLAGADYHQVQIRQTQIMGVNNDNLDPDQLRIDVTAPAAMASIPAGTLDSANASEIRLRAIKTDSGNGGVADSNSKWLLVSPGIKGLFNVELGTVLPQQYWAFQVYLQGTSGALDVCFLVPLDDLTSPSMSCSGGSIDFATNIVSLNLVDLDGTLTGTPSGTFTLDLSFYDSGNARVTSPDIAALNGANATSTHARMVNPGVRIRSLRASNGSQQTHIAVRNGMNTGSGDLYNTGTFQANDNSMFVVNGSTSGTSSLAMWNNGVSGEEYENNAGIYVRLPTDDGAAQAVGNFLRKRTNSDAGLGAGLLAAARYRLTWNSSSMPSMRWVFNQDYAAPDPSAMVAPVFTGVTVDMGGASVTAGTTGTIASPIDVSGGPTFGLTWAGSTVANGQWQITVTDTITSAQVRTPWMDASHADLTSSGGNWVWVNPGGITVQAGQTVELQIRTRDAANTMLGGQSPADRVYLMRP